MISLGSTLRLSRASAFIAAFVLAVSVPVVLRYEESSVFFTVAVLATVIVWLSMKWPALKALSGGVTGLDVLAGVGILGANYARNLLLLGGFGIADMLISFVGAAVAFYGLRALRFFLLPAVYILILVVGYQLEVAFAEVRGLETWLAGLMGGMMQSLGVPTEVTGNIVAIYGSSALLLQVSGQCTGIKGMLAFGSLSTMTVLDVKTRLRRILLVVGVGTAGIFLINLARLAIIFLSAHYIGLDLALAIHSYLGFLLFIGWVLAFWSLAFKHLLPAAPIKTIQAPSPLAPTR